MEVNDYFCDFTNQSQTRNTRRQLIQNEGLSYVQSGEFTSDLSTLQKFPCVGRLFCKTNTMTASSAIVERL